MKAFRVFAFFAVLFGLAMAVFAASVDESETALEPEMEVDNELTEQFNAQAFDAEEESEVMAEGEELDTGVDRRGAWRNKYPPMPPRPAARCCYWKGYSYSVGTWYGNCYCDKSGQWVCVKPKPPAPKCCVWNGKNYYEGEYAWFNNCYYCYCSGGKWTKCNYVKPKPAPKPAPKPWYHKKW